MKHPRFLRRATATTCAIVLGACAVQPQPPVEAAQVLRPVSIQAQATGAGQRFVQCTDCEPPTTKTLGARAFPTVKTAAVRVALVPEPVAAVEPERLSVTFAFGSAELGPRAKSQLKELAARLPAQSRVLVTGFTDNAGPASPNTKLAEARALAVMLDLRALMPDTSVEIKARGQALCCYVASNARDTGREINRRAELEISPALKAAKPTTAKEAT